MNSVFKRIAGRHFAAVIERDVAAGETALPFGISPCRRRSFDMVLAALRDEPQPPTPAVGDALARQKEWLELWERWVREKGFA